MASTTYAAVHVGSNELCMKIYEMSRQNGIRQLTYVRHPLSLGAESYTEGVISYQTLSEICNTPVSYTHLDVYKRQIQVSINSGDTSLK